MNMLISTFICVSIGAYHVEYSGIFLNETYLRYNKGKPCGSSYES